MNKLTQLKQIHKHQQFMDDLGVKLKLIEIEDWLKVSREKIIENGGKSIISVHYLNDKRKLLSTIYPNYPWDFKKIRHNDSKYNYFKLISNQRKFMDNLYEKFKFKSFDDWESITKVEIMKNGGKTLILTCYEKNLQKLLSNVYPNYPFDFISSNYRQNKLKRKKYLNFIENQRSIMSDLFVKLKLNSIENWSHITKKEFCLNGGTKLYRYYDRDFKKLLLAIYPNQHWKFKLSRILPIHTLENHQKLMDNFYQIFELKQLDDWHKISCNKFDENRGRSLLRYYSNNKFKLLTTIYPNYPWKIDEFPTTKFQFFSELTRQQKFMDFLFTKFKLQSISDWIKIPRNYLVENGAKILLHKYYSNDMQKLLKNIYPNFPWNLDVKEEEQNKFIQLMIEKYMIKERKDWYRIKFDDYLMDCLKSKFNDYKWDKRSFLNRSKKSQQRLVFISLSQIYPFHLLFENYHHPKLLFNFYINNDQNTDHPIVNNNKLKIILNNLIDENNVNNIKNNKNKNNNNNDKNNKQKEYQKMIYQNKEISMNYRFLEYDIFVPTLNMAIEYQGEQHYDDLPMGFSPLEEYRSRDVLKRFLSEKLKIKLITVPYWCDLSLASLRNAFRL